MRVTFWGVRGTFPATGAAFQRYGGDTMCVEIEGDGVRVILDAGSGLRAVGDKLRDTGDATPTHIFISHPHLDHVMGLSHFAPLWRDDAMLTCWAAEAEDNPGYARDAFVLARPPFFPIDIARTPARVRLAPYSADRALSLESGVTVTPFALNHPGVAYGFCVAQADRKVCYVCDHEHGDDNIDARIAAAAGGADMIIYDATFTDEEFAARRGWGHSTWQAGLALKRRAGAKLVAFAHHDPRRTDAELDQLAEQAAARGANAFFARQGLVIDL